MSMERTELSPSERWHRKLTLQLMWATAEAARLQQAGRLTALPYFSDQPSAKPNPTSAATPPSGTAQLP